MRLGATILIINYLEIANITPGTHPSFANSSIASDGAGVYLNSAINLDVSLPNGSAAVDEATLNTNSVKLYRTKDSYSIPGIVGTSEGGALKNKLLVAEYSGGDDILALAPGPNGNIPRGNVKKHQIRAIFG